MQPSYPSAEILSSWRRRWLGIRGALPKLGLKPLLHALFKIRRGLQIFRALATVLGLGGVIALTLRRLLGTGPVKLQFEGLRHPLICRPAESDYFVLRDIFAGRECDVSPPAEPRFIVDGGANVGYAAIYYANRFPGARILAIEPDETNCAMLRKNSAPYPNIEIVQAGLWDASGALVISNPNDASWEFQVQEVPAGTPGRSPR